MNVAVFGIGYVGSVCAACLTQFGHRVVAVDTSLEKTDLINSGISPVVEAGLDSLIAAGVSSGSLAATTSAAEAIKASDLALICVGTPSEANGAPNLDFVFSVIRQIGSALKQKSTFYVITLRSTAPPGTLAKIESILEDTSGKRAGIGFAVAVNPEFLREGSAIQDFNNPPFTLVGANSEKATAQLQDLYADLSAEFLHVEPGVAEMVKYASNGYHALKVAFANEIGKLCREQNIDGHSVMDIFCRDQKLNISPAYLRPGIAYGGSCLPKDVSALANMGRETDTALHLVSSISISNRSHLDYAINLVLKSGCTRIGFLGLSFKAGTDDLRGSPLVAMAGNLIEKGKVVHIYDPNIDVSRLIGANKAFAHEHLKDLESIMVASSRDIMDNSECIVVGHATEQFSEAIKTAKADQQIIDLVRLDGGRLSGSNYCGLCW
jgi:GDP-mannose 6-dehydrogenase